ncbi:MAG: DUF6351 family protein [Rhodospirillaceae bacterium]|nr:DUF6351 family protein [Rhodospirillaceae bacterium]
MRFACIIMKPRRTPVGSRPPAERECRCRDPGRPASRGIQMKTQIGTSALAGAWAFAVVLAHAGAARADDTDWGGGYRTGVDSATQTAVTSSGIANAGSAPSSPEVAARCARLAGFATAYSSQSSTRDRFMRIPDAPTSVLGAEIVPAERDLPEVCFVRGVIAPDINFELRLPTNAWNGKLMYHGCGGACGVIYRPQAEEPLVRGYAVFASDMGHSAAPNNWSFRMGDVSAIIDFTYRATHVGALAAKEIVDEFYGQPARWSYFMGCSTGGVQGMIEAQRFPHDFDGIIAGAPAYSTGPSYLEWGARANLDADGTPIFDPAKLPMVRKAVLAACDAQDGTADGLLQDPRRCSWDPKELVCKGRNAATCLTAAEADVVRKIYAGPMNSKGETLSFGYAGMARGSEYVWSPSFIGLPGQKAQRVPDLSASFGEGFFPVIAANAGRPYDYDTDPQRGNIGGLEGNLTQWLRYAQNPDLRRFQRAGAKMIAYHGWDDNETAPGASADYYDLVTRTMGGEAATKDFFRLFMIPGMGHCRRGPGGDTVDFIHYLEQWVEHGRAPDQVIVHHLVKEQGYLGLPRIRFPLAPDSYDRTRPVYAYPDTAVWTGQGDIAKAENWAIAPRPERPATNE